MAVNGVQSGPLNCNFSNIMLDTTKQIKLCLAEDDLSAVITHLKIFTSHTTKDEFRNCVPEDSLQVLAQVLHRASGRIQHPIDEAVQQVTAECFRSLRNSCVGRPNNQSYIANRTSALEDASVILLGCLNQHSVFYSACVLTCVQFIGNIVVCNKENQALLWNKYYGLLRTLLITRTNIEKLGNCAAMVVYNILLGCPQLVVERDLKLLEALIDHVLLDSEFASFVIEQLLLREGYLADMYLQVSTDRKLIMLESAHSILSLADTISGEDGKLSVSAVTFLAQQLKDRSDCILKTVGHYAEALEPTEVAKLLEIISSASANKPYMGELQKDMSLLIDCAFLLRSIHDLGKSGENSFTSIQRLSELAPAGGDVHVQSHPAFGFKCNLVRLLGNLCWRHRLNQDQVRDLDCIPLLLDCCNMDARNPLIIQWVVMAVRNVCEDNPNNQAVIASMNRQGGVSSAVLAEMGLTLREGDDGINIAPLPR